MLPPTRLSLFCALLLLYLLLALFFTIYTPTKTITTYDCPDTVFATKPFAPPPPPPPPGDDDSLFRAASRANPNPVHPKKVAFMFLTTAPLPFAPLWELYFNQTRDKLFNIYIHADPTRHYDPPFSGVFANRVIPSKPAKRFTPSLAAAARRLLAYALLDDPSNSMFALLSPSCVPIRSFNFTYHTLTQSNRSFIEILKDEMVTYDRWAARGDEAMLPEVKLENFRIGSQFWVLTRKHAWLVASDKTVWPKFNKSCIAKWKTECYPEENYFPTLIHMRDPHGAVPATLTRVQWRGGFEGHPRTFNASHVNSERFDFWRNKRPRYGYDTTNGSDPTAEHRHDPFLFVRKFTPDSIHALMSAAMDVVLKD